MEKRSTFPASVTMRGEIYWVENQNAVGHEMMKTRPAVIVSCGALADTSPVVNVVYLSAGERLRDGHVIIRTRDGLSMAHCENVYSVDKCRLGTYVGRCSKEEMARIDAAIARALGLPVPTPKPETPDTAAVERDIYRKICEGMLNRVLLDRKETE